MMSKNKTAETYCWNFVFTKNQCDAVTVVVQVPSVRLTIGGYLWRRGSWQGTNPPLMAWGREACEVLVLHTLASSWAGLRSLSLQRRLEPAWMATTQHLASQDKNSHLNVIVPLPWSSSAFPSVHSYATHQKQSVSSQICNMQRFTFCMLNCFKHLILLCSYVVHVSQQNIHRLH